LFDTFFSECLAAELFSWLRTLTNNNLGDQGAEAKLGQFSDRLDDGVVKDG
jgi:hypothetical protein